MGFLAEVKVHMLFNCSVKQQKEIPKCSVPIFGNLIKKGRSYISGPEPDMSLQACLENPTKRCMFKWCEAITINHSSS